MKVLALVVCMAFCLFGAAEGTIIHVPGDSATIQLGLNGASTGDTVLVAPGTYPENIFWPLVNGIKLFSELGRDTTVIDGGSASSVIYFSGMGTIDTSTHIRGFAIEDGGSVCSLWWGHISEEFFAQNGGQHHTEQFSDRSWRWHLLFRPIFTFYSRQYYPRQLCRLVWWWCLLR